MRVRGGCTVRRPESVAEYREGLAVIAAAWREAFGEIVDDGALRRVTTMPADDELRERYETVLADPNIAVRVAIRDGAVVGSGSVRWPPAEMEDFVPADAAEIRTLYVDPAAWGQGIGTAVLDGLLAAIPDTLDRVVLQTLSANADGRSFYESRGFALVKEHDFQVAQHSYPTVVYERAL